jgi:hypothetical protein
MIKHCPLSRLHPTRPARRVFPSRIFLTALLLAGFTAAAQPGDYFEIDVVDSATGRGVPLIELETVNHIRYYTDSAGRIAFNEPSLNNQTVFFYVRGDGYEYPKDGFGMAGVRLKPTPGGRAEVKVKRVNLAERLYRITGQGLYRDSILLGHSAPIKQPLMNGQVFGQDSVQPIVHNDKIYWFWGDTLRPSYPLGNFRMSGAVSALPENGGLDPSIGMNLDYFTDAEGFCKGMFPLPPKGDLIWADGFLTLTNENHAEILLAHYERLKGLGKSLGHGIAIYNDKTEEFEHRATFDLKKRWRAPHGHPIRQVMDGKAYYLFGNALPTVRVEARLEAILDPSQYEAYSCLAEGSEAVGKDSKLNRDEQGRLIYRWTGHAVPTGPFEEKKLIEAGLIKPEEARFRPLDAESGDPVLIHSGSVYYNQYRKRWIMIAVQSYGSSYLGELWYAEADQPTGPWRKARKIVTHKQYSFYNPVQQPFFDQDGGRIIYFQGTYTADFSGNKFPTPRYDYNQIMYRLDLANPGLKDVQSTSGR